MKQKHYFVLPILQLSVTKPAKCLLVAGLMAFPVSSMAEPALMQPIQDVHFQELPPPWEAQPLPQIPAATKPKVNTPVAPKVVQKPVHKPAKAKPVARAPVAVAQAPKAPASLQSLQSAAQRGDAEAAYQLGIRYQYGNGVQASRSQAHKWLNKAASANHARAQYALSMFYQQYARNEQGIKKALLWLKRAADQGLADAQYSLGMMFKNGSLVHPNQAESRKWLQMAANQGHTAAQLALR